MLTAFDAISSPTTKMGWYLAGLADLNEKSEQDEGHSNLAFTSLRREQARFLRLRLVSSEFSFPFRPLDTCPPSHNNVLFILLFHRC